LLEVIGFRQSITPQPRRLLADASHIEDYWLSLQENISPAVLPPFSHAAISRAITLSSHAFAVG